MRRRQHNERIKVWSSVVGKLGAVLFAAVAGLICSGNGSNDLFGWGFAALPAMVGAGGMMNLLVDEDT